MTRSFSLSKLFLLLERAVPHASAQLAVFRATPQLMHLTLSGSSLRRKRHESVMSSVMNSNMGNGPKPLPTTERERAQAGKTADLGPHQISSAVVSVWPEEKLSVP